MDAAKLRIIFLIFAAVLFLAAYNFACVGPYNPADFAKGIVVFSFCLSGCAAFVAAAIVKKDS
jgi:hypothetical protein